MPCKLYLDESGNLADELPCTLVATLNADRSTRKRLSRIPKKVRERVMDDELRTVPELKFHNSNNQTRHRFLEYVAKYEPEVYALILDKENRQIDDTPYNYAIMVWKLLTVVSSTKNKKEFDLFIDKKYTNPKHRQEFNQTVSCLLKPLEIQPNIDHLGGEEENLIQVADFLAGTFLRKEVFNDSQYYRLISDIIERETKVKWTKIKAAVERKKRK